MIDSPFLKRKHWIFDMDGTLTIAQHDFEAMRIALGLPKGRPILETLAQLPAKESAPLHRQLNDIELEIAQDAKPAQGAAQLLEYLLSQGNTIGILTRNNAINIEVTLKAASLADYFLPENLLGRDCATPKPSPDGVLALLKQWQAMPDDGIMVGDFLFDLQAGNAAGTATVYIDPSEQFPFNEHANVCITRLDQLLI